jgi:replication factor C subunit 3/5
MFAKWMQMQTVLSYVARRAYFDLPPEAAQEIIKDSGGNLRKAILVLEALKMQSCVVVSFSFSVPAAF